MPTEKKTALKPRADALRNRQTLIDTARALLSAGHFELRIEEIAKRAGLGVGTFYRHFETREALIEAVYQQEVDQFCAFIEPLLNSLPPAEALFAFLARLIDYLVANKGLASTLSLGINSEAAAQGKDQLLAAFSELAQAAAATGHIRQDISPRAILMALDGICTSTESPDWETDSRALIAVLIDGLRYPAKQA